MVNGNTKSCGCLKKFKDISGNKINSWNVLKYSHKNKRNSAMYICQCECGEIKIIEGTTLTNNRSNSCGCKKNYNIKHGMSNKNNKNEIERKLYRKWEAIKQRCYNSKNISYKNYGALGVKVCKDWLDDFYNFYKWSIKSGYEVGLTIDRIDSNGDYEPDNCRFLTHSEQQNNKKHHHYVTYNGETKNVSQWEKHLGINKGVLRVNLIKGVSMEDFLKKRGINYGN